MSGEGEGPIAINMYLVSGIKVLKIRKEIGKMISCRYFHGNSYSDYNFALQ